MRISKRRERMKMYINLLWLSVYALVCLAAILLIVLSTCGTKKKKK